MEPLAGNQKKYIAEIFIGIGYLAFFCLALTLCYAFYIFTYLKQPIPPINTFATSLPPTTLIPNIDPTNQHSTSIIFKDDFHNDSHGWASTNESSKTEVTLGKLILRGQTENSFAATGCGSCPFLQTPFYLQADFSTGMVTDKGFGVYFNFDANDGSFFLFRINTEARKYYFYHGTNDNWSLRAAGETSQIKSFPATNTLGIYANQGTVEFYVNGKIIDSYEQSENSFYKGDFGFYVDGSSFALVVDNLTINKTGK